MLKPTYLSVAQIHVLCALCLFLPLIFDVSPQFNYDIRLVPACESRLFEDTFLVMIAVAVLLTFEFFLDYRPQSKLSIPRFLILVSFLLPSLLTLLSSSLSARRKAQLFICCFEFRNSLTFGALLSALIELQPNDVLKKRTLSICIVAALIFTYFVWEPFITATAATRNISALCNFILLIAVIWLVFVNCEGLIRVFKTSGRLSVSTLTDEEKYSIIFALCLNLNFVCQFVIFFVYENKSWDDIQITEIVGFVYCNIFFGVMAFLTTGRIELARAHKQQNLLETKKNFVRYISHEVRTPLNIVYMGLQFLTSDANRVGTENQDNAVLLGEVLDACKLAIGILNELLLYDKVEDGKLVLETEVISAQELLRDAIAPFKAQAAEKAVSLRYEGDDHFPLSLCDTGILVDINKFSQVIRNLVSNAIKFSPARESVDIYAFATRQLKCSSTMLSGESESQFSRFFDVRGRDANILPNEEEAEDMLRIEVHDRGPGISEDDQKKLFQEIIQFNASQLQGGGGSGLGLWISSAIVAKHGGNIGVKSSGVPGEGCVFYVEIPIVSMNGLHALPRSDPILTIESHRDMVQPSSYQELGGAGIETDNGMLLSDLERSSSRVLLHRPRALVVDDSPLNVKMLSRAIRPYFDTILEADDGSKAIEIVKRSLQCEGAEGPVDVIFMDAVMNVVHGPEACVAIRKMGFKGKIIAVTGNTLSEDVDHFLSCGANVLIGKPLQVSNLVKVLSDQGIDVGDK